MAHLDKFQREVGQWAEETFPKAVPGSIVAHLRREVEELAAATHLGPIEDEEAEAADCLLLLLHLAHRGGYSLQGVAAAKFLANKQRKWGQPDAEGVVEHVRQ